MNRTICLGLGIAGLALTGCSSTPRQESANTLCTNTHVVSMGAFRPAAAEATSEVFVFGAGDALGEAVFLQYVASLRAEDMEMRFATGAIDYPFD